MPRSGSGSLSQDPDRASPVTGRAVELGIFAGRVAQLGSGFDFFASRPALP